MGRGGATTPTRPPSPAANPHEAPGDYTRRGVRRLRDTAAAVRASPGAVARPWLALAIILLALLVLVGAAWAAGELAERSEGDAADARLATVVRAAGDEFDEVLAGAEARARTLATATPVQRAFADGDPAALTRLAAAEEDVTFVLAGRPLAGPPPETVRRSADVVREGRTLGTVVVSIPLDELLVERLARGAGLMAEDRLLLVEGEGVTAGAAPAAELPPGPAGEATVAGERVRYVAAPLLAGEDVRLAAVTPAEAVAAAADELRQRLLLAGVATLALVALLGWGTARLLRVPEPVPEPVHGRRARDVGDGERSSDRMREAVALVGEALAATHDPEALLPVILESGIRATGAVGGRLIAGGEELARAGTPERGGAALALRLGTEDEPNAGQLLLYPPRGRPFGREEDELAHWLAGQAGIALENARLHRVVKRQAITDELTQLANRRRFSETLGLEVLRAERFGDPLALVLADLDDFKRINDRFGHQTGDEVLRAFADILRENVREFDLTVRYGGEEFAVLLPETGLEGAERLARRLASALARVRLPDADRERTTVTASFGVAAYPGAGSAADLIAEADKALYQAKAEGKNTVVCAGEGNRRGG